jgi:hypothetical protein
LYKTRTTTLEDLQASSDATTKLTDSKANIACNVEIPGGSVVPQKAVQVSYRNQWVANKTD